VVGFTTPLRERTEEWLADPDRLDAVLAEGASRARTVADRTLATVNEAVGFLPLRP
jgi:tryptophanyl-tRNA synthetase